MVEPIGRQSTASATNFTEARAKRPVSPHSTQATSAAATMKIPYPSGPRRRPRYAAVSSPLGMSRLSARSTRMPPRISRPAGSFILAGLRPESSSPA